MKAAVPFNPGRAISRQLPPLAAQPEYLEVRALYRCACVITESRTANALL